MTVDALPEHLADLPGWVEIPGLGWLREVPQWNGGESPVSDFDYWWWHDCPAKPDGHGGVWSIDVSSGERHAVLGGSLEAGDLTIGGGSGSILCPPAYGGCGLHGWVRDGRWVPA